MLIAKRSKYTPWQTQIIEAVTHSFALSCRPLNGDHPGRSWCGAEVCKQPLGN